VKQIGPAFGVGWPLEGSLDKTVVNEVYRVIVKKKRKRKKPNTQENAKRLKLVFRLSCLFKFRQQFIGRTAEKSESFSLDG
jgi:hypothetical protein